MGAPLVALADADPSSRGPGSDVADPSLAYLLARVGLIERRVRRAVARRRRNDPDPDDGFRGLYISEAQVDALLAEPRLRLTAPDGEAELLLVDLERQADDAQAADAPFRLRELARAFALDELDVELLLVALAPDLDPRFERLYGYLHDDVSRRRASIGLALELCAPPESSFPGNGPGRARFGPHGRLLAGALVTIDDADRPFLTRSVRVADRVAAHLMGDDAVDGQLSNLLADEVPPTQADVALARAIGAGDGLAYVREAAGSSGQAMGEAAFRGHGRPSLAIDLNRLPSVEEAAEIARTTAREARLRGAGLVIGPVDSLAERAAGQIRSLADEPVDTVLFGSRTWDPAWSSRPPLLVAAPVPTVAEREAAWLDALGNDVPPDLDPAQLTGQFRLSLGQIERAAQAARSLARADGRLLTVADLYAGARSQSAQGLERLARRIEPFATWDDLVVPEDVETQLRELVARVRHRDKVIDEWGMGPRTGQGRGITALFAGESGTGKTLSAEVIAKELGFDLYVVDLSTVVDKYIGETEKNLDRIFTEADRVNGVLLFDEADALFGKRTETKDAHDRHANVEVAYLLQRMDQFDGLAVLTTNLRANLDDSFTRRLDALIDFPMPDRVARRRIWLLNLPPPLPQADDVDLDFLGERFKLSGGNIRNICLSAAYLAASGGDALDMRVLIRATEQECRKLGYLPAEEEFGPYLPLVEGEAPAESQQRPASAGEAE